MSLTNHTNFSLLDQQEIDALVKFLTEKKNTVDSDVMSQSSIDKLIMLIKTDKERLSSIFSMTYGAIDSTLLKKLKFRDNDQDLCELHFSVDDDTNYVVLSVYNTVSQKTLKLMPSMLDEQDEEEWGYAIAPIFFTHISHSLTLKFTQDTYDAVCELYATHNFGTPDYKIPELFLPDNFALLECIL